MLNGKIWKNEKLFAEAKAMMQTLVKRFMEERGILHQKPETLDSCQKIVTAAIEEEFGPDAAHFAPFQILINARVRINGLTEEQAVDALDNAFDEIVETIYKKGYEGLLA